MKPVYQLCLFRRPKMLLSRPLALLLTLSLIACTTIDPYSGEQKTSNAAKGAGIGAISGALLGAATSKDKSRGALTGALVGGAVGGGVGYYMDRQEAELRKQLEGTGVRIKREGDNLRLVMPGNITFATGRAEINARFYDVLNSVGIVLKKYDKTAVKISGYTDSTGSDRTNQTLSEQRAASVGQYLIGRGVKAGRIQTAGYGARYPIAANTTSVGRVQNRRVEMELLPL
jgi:outer membrane protein OmpA-like peptidoglycan-associated protein